MLDNLKKIVVQIAKDADKKGMCKHKSGNFSIRDPQTGYVVITPSGVDREVLTDKDICVMDLDANVIERNSQAKPSSEVLMHLEIYKNRKDVNAIVHTHAKYSTSFAVLNCPIPPIVYESAYLGKSGLVPVAPYARPGTMELAHNVGEKMKETDCCLMEKHGAISIGTDMEDAYLKAQYLEEIAEMYYLSLTANNCIEPSSLEQTELQKWSYPSEIKL